MSTITNIGRISMYRPTSGNLLDMYELLDEVDDREKAVDLWLKEGKTRESFRWAYKSLKDKLLDGIFLNSFNDFETAKKIRIECWKRLAQVKTLLVADQRKAAIEVASQALKLAEKCGFLDIAVAISKELYYHYGTIDLDIRKYRRYRKKVRIFREELRKEEDLYNLYVEFSFLDLKKRDTSHLEKEIMKYKSIDSDWYKFNLFKYSLLATVFIKKGEHTNVIRYCNDAITYFRNSDSILPYSTLWHFYRQLTPYLINKKLFAQAESKLNESILLPATGSQNWHVNLLQKAYLGFQSNKPMMSYQTWKLAQQYPINLPVINECWQIVYAYLVLFEKLGRIQIQLPEKFRLARFLNSVPLCDQDKEEANVAIIIITLLHHLLDGNFDEYLKKAETLPSYWQAHLRGPAHERKKFFLKLLEKVYHHHFRRYRMETLVKKDLKNFKESKPEISLDAVSAELVPYEALWDIVLNHLK
ncbi:MAG: hypothetical protein R2788_09705 [Saprospiraceae bacterium]